MSTPTPTIPEGLDLLSAANGLVIRKVWLTWKIAPLALFAIVWDGFLFFWYHQVLSQPHPPLVAVLFPIGHIAVGIGITYYVIASLVNKTDIIISSSSVRVAIGPAPWIGNKEVSVDEITEVVVRERSGNRGGKSYTVMYADHARKERKLAASFPESDQAEFVAQTIRDSLGLNPQEV
jgi:hypothetical protein